MSIRQFRVELGFLLAVGVVRRLVFGAGYNLSQAK